MPVCVARVFVSSLSIGEVELRPVLSYRLCRCVCCCGLLSDRTRYTCAGRQVCSSSSLFYLEKAIIPGLLRAVSSASVSLVGTVFYDLICAASSCQLWLVVGRTALQRVKPSRTHSGRRGLSEESWWRCCAPFAQVTQRGGRLPCACLPVGLWR